jgi:rifampicin phosphotransferase
MGYIVRCGAIGDSIDPARLGRKAAALATLQRAGLPVPAWMVVTPEALTASLEPDVEEAIAQACAAGDAASLGAALAGVQVVAAVRAELEAALAELAPDGAPLAVRSSAVEEDGARHSFAGQLDTFLDVRPLDVAERVADVWRSAFQPRILAYRRAHGLSPLSPPAVLVQRMVQAESAGVAFSADPVSGRRGVAVVSAVRGLAAALVAGERDGDTYEVDRAGAVVRRAPLGSLMPGMASRERDTERAATAAIMAHMEQDACAQCDESARVLDDEQVRGVAALARRCERICGQPQDVEWACAGGTIFLLQSRPITTLAALADPDGAYNLWDNSNISESYAGVTTPLTFSFARHVYEEVYRQLCRTLGAPESLMLEHADTFHHMLGLIQGRVYYNLLSWYRLLALLPGFTVNRRFMEQMMGVKEGLPESVLAELSAATWRDRVDDARRLATAIVGLAVAYMRLPGSIRRFQRRLDAALGTTPPPLESMRADELVAYYRQLERQLVTRWDAPLVNDLFAMMLYGVLRTLAARWCGDTAGTLQNDLLSGEGGLISAEPAARVREMAALVAREPGLSQTLAAGITWEIERALAAYPALRAAYDAYLDRFADRCLEELKLESPTLRDDPLPLLRALGHLAQHGTDGASTVEAPDQAAGVALRQQGEAHVRAALACHPLQRLVFGWVLAGARARVRDRENLRFERTRVFGRVRRTFVELGRRLAALDALDDARDIFYLEVEEALGYVTGSATCTDLRGLVALRRAEFARYRQMEPPADRFETRGVVYAGNAFRAPAVSQPANVDADDGDRRTGLGCCPGVVMGRVRLVVDPKDAQVRVGEILVAERTDPGWIMLFPAAAGVLVERGSLLSHSAIVARELGIPTIVGLAGATRWLRDGDWVEMDGGTGVVRRTDAPLGATAMRQEVTGHA